MSCQKYHLCHMHGMSCQWMSCYEMSCCGYHVIMCCVLGDIMLYVEKHHVVSDVRSIMSRDMLKDMSCRMLEDIMSKDVISYHVSGGVMSCCVLREVISCHKYHFMSCEHVKKQYVGCHVERYRVEISN